MMGIGPVEIAILLVVTLFSLVVPVITLVLVFLMYDKVKRIEEILRQRG